MLAARRLRAHASRHRSLPRPLAAARRDHHAEPFMVRRRDGAAGHRADRDHAERHAASRPGALHQHLRPLRRQALLQLRLATTSATVRRSSTASRPSRCPTTCSRSSRRGRPSARSIAINSPAPATRSTSSRPRRTGSSAASSKQVPGIIDITTFGGTTRQYQVEADPNKLLSYGVTLPQVINAIQSSQRQRRRQLPPARQPERQRPRHRPGPHHRRHRLTSSSRRRTVPPSPSRDIGKVSEGFQPRLGQVGRNKQNDIVLGIVLLQKDEKSLPALKALKEKIDAAQHRQPASAGHAHQHHLRPHQPHRPHHAHRPRRHHHRTRPRHARAALHARRPAHYLHRRRDHSLRRALRLRHDGAHRPLRQPHLHRRHRLRHSRRLPPSLCSRASIENSPAASPAKRPAT